MKIKPAEWLFLSSETKQFILKKLGGKNNGIIRKG